MKIHLNEDQQNALRLISDFIADKSASIFILRGSAGTGKTTLLAYLVDLLSEKNISYAMATPTGRASRILGNKIQKISSQPSAVVSTIHRLIYASPLVKLNDGDNTDEPIIRLFFPVKENETTPALLIVDESSMIGDKASASDDLQFGSGRLLSDIIKYAKLHHDKTANFISTKIIFVGDPLQLPPIMENTSPALSKYYFESNHKAVVETYELTKVIRQASDSAVLSLATNIRDLILKSRFNNFEIKPNGVDIDSQDTKNAVSQIVELIKNRKSCAFVVYSNAAAHSYNRIIRSKLYADDSPQIKKGDILLVNKNSTKYELSNGDLVKVCDLISTAEIFNIKIAGHGEVTLSFRRLDLKYKSASGDTVVKRCLILQNLLDSPKRNISALECRALFIHFKMRNSKYKTNTSEFWRALQDDEYYNALHVKYGYALTCHKAQGGEWDTVAIDFKTQASNRNEYFFRWAYTAITRSKQRVIAVNFENFTSISDIKWANQDEPGMPNRTNDALLNINSKLLCEWQRKLIKIEKQKSHKNCEEFFLSRGDERATVKYYYDKNYKITNKSVISNQYDNGGIEADILESIDRIKLDSCINSSHPEFIKEFVFRIRRALEKSPIEISYYEVLDYRLRVCFERENQRQVIDFIYDKKQTWKHAEKVGKCYSNNTIYSDVRNLIQISK